MALEGDTTGGRRLDQLQTLRESRGITQAELARRAGISSQSLLSRIENGERDASPDVVDALCKALDYPASSLDRYQQRFGLGVSFYRKRVSASARSVKQLEASINKRFQELDVLFAGVDIDAPFEIPVLDPGDFGDDVEHIAQAVRAEWQIPSGPIHSVVSAIEDAGGVVFRWALPNKKVDAVSIRRFECSMFILGAEAPPDRQRFSVCHELGHAVMHSTFNADVESQADRFAAEFLMPASDIKPYLRNMSVDLAMQLKPTWKVSAAALIRRARDLKVITESRYRGLFIELSRLGYRKSEPQFFDPEIPTAQGEILQAYCESVEMNLDDVCELRLGLHASEALEVYLGTSRLRIVK